MVLDLVVANEDIHLAVVVEVEDQHSQSFALRLQAGAVVFGVHAAFVADIREGAVAVVLVQDALVALKLLGAASDKHLFSVYVLVGAIWKILQVHDDVTAHEDVEEPVAVQVGEGTTRAPAVGGDAGFAGHFAKAPAALAVRLIMKEVAVSVTGNEQVREAVIVIVADGDALAEAGMPDAGFLRDVREAAVAVVVVQARRRTSTLFVGRDREPPSLHQQQVHVAVLIVVDPGGAAPHDFGDVMLFRGAVDMQEVDAGRLGQFAETDARLFRKGRPVVHGVVQRHADLRAAPGWRIAAAKVRGGSSEAKRKAESDNRK
jgi:hypothetical protein